MLAVDGHVKVAFFILLFVAFECHAMDLKDFRDGRSYKMKPSESLNWFDENLDFKANALYSDDNDASYYVSDMWERSCPEGTHLPGAIEWDNFIRDRFGVPRRVQNMKSFVGSSTGYYDGGDEILKNSTNDLAYFAVAGVGMQAMRIDAKRGEVKLVELDENDAVLIRCVGERDFLAEKGVDKNDMLMTDERDGKKYKVEMKAGKLWMRANLAYSLSSAKQCFMEDSAYCIKFGRFYKHEEALKACPEGWHLPDDGEWRDFQRDRAQLDWDNLGQGGCRDWDEYCDAATTGHYWSSASIVKGSGRSWEFRRAVRSINRTDESDQKGLYVRCVANMGE